MHGLHFCSHVCRALYRLKILNSSDCKNGELCFFVLSLEKEKMARKKKSPRFLKVFMCASYEPHVTLM